jgi:hypothetical protein
MPVRSVAAFAAFLFVSFVSAEASAQGRWTVDFENGAAIAGYNNVRIPGDTGTLFSLTDDLTSNPAYFWRARAEVRLGPKHVVGVLVAPLEIDAAGSFSEPVSFAGETFPAGVPVTARYVFNSYRVTYRYDFVRRANWTFGLGITGKIRDALTQLDSSGLSAKKTNVGFVPLVNFNLERRLASRVTFQFSGDALAAPQGRAEDIFAGVVVALRPGVALKAGYRLLEGGADTDEVYTFAAIHYAAVGAVFRF